MFGQIYEVLRQIAILLIWDAMCPELRMKIFCKKNQLFVLIIRIICFLHWGFPTERNSGFIPKLTISLAQARLFYAMVCINNQMFIKSATNCALNTHK